MPSAFGLRTSTLRGGDTLRYTSTTPQLYQIDIESVGTTTSSDVFPTLLVQVAFDSDPIDNVPIWTDLTSYCRQISFTRGRSFELDDVQAGTATFTFNNLDRTLDPTYTAGPYYGQLTPRRRIRFSATFGGVTYARFDGFVDAWPQNAPDPSRTFAEVVLTATDLFGWLGRNNVRVVAPMVTNDPVFGQTNGPYKTGGQLTFPKDESCQSRINRILDLWPLPPSMRAIDAGNTFLNGDINLDATETSLNYLRRITASESGRLFISKEGAVTFQARDHWMTSGRQLNAIVNLSDEAQPGYASLVMDPADQRYVRNRIVRSRKEFPTPFVAQDIQSILTNGTLEDSKLDCLTKYKVDLRAQVKWLLAKYVDPKPRFSSVTVKPRRNPALLFPAVLSAELGDRINLSSTQTNVGDPLVQDCWIEQITETIGPMQYEVNYSVAPVDVDSY